jgi:hypothetical protein
MWARACVGGHASGCVASSVWAISRPLPGKHFLKEWDFSRSVVTEDGDHFLFADFVVTVAAFVDGLDDRFELFLRDHGFCLFGLDGAGPAHFVTVYRIEANGLRRDFNAADTLNHGFSLMLSVVQWRYGSAFSHRRRLPAETASAKVVSIARPFGLRRGRAQKKLGKGQVGTGEQNRIMLF